MNCWTTLGLEPCNDARAIKRAYARRLKDVHPEDHPEQFMQLRQAYETALQYCGERNIQRPAMQNTVEQRPPAAPAAEAPPPSPALSAEPLAAQQEQQARLQEQAAGRQQRAQALSDAFVALLEDAERRQSVETWDTLLCAPELASLDLRLMLGARLLPQLLTQLQADEQPLPAPVLLALDDCFQWSHDQSMHWPVSDDSLQRFCLMVQAARENQDWLSRSHMGWGWCLRAMFSWRGRLNRLEYFLVQGLLIGTLLSVTTLTMMLLPGEFPGYLLGVWLIAGYGILTVHIKRIRDTGTNPAVGLLAALILPFLHLLYMLGSSAPDLAQNNPRHRYTDPYQVAWQELFQDGHHATLAAHLKAFCKQVENSLVYTFLTVLGLLLLLVRFG